MTGQPAPDQDAARPERINFFRPRPGFMRREVTFIWLALCGWALVTFGFQGLLALQGGAEGSAALTERTVFGFPFHFWFSGQFLIVWFILLCFFFNVLVDRLTERYRKRR